MLGRVQIETNSNMHKHNIIEGDEKHHVFRNIFKHLKFFKEAVDQPQPAGRRLNFLTQEINRELNTIGSKANDSGIAHHVVRAKEMLEKIREQVQNVE